MSTKKLHLPVIATVLLNSIISASASPRQQSPAEAPQTKTTLGALKVIYLVGDKGELGSSDLKAHSEVAVVHTWADFKALAVHKKVALWIDKGAISLVKTDETYAWLHQEPQKWYPIVLVGYSDALYSFRESLPYFGISGPMVDWKRQKVGSGFSLWAMQEESLNGRSATLQGFKVKPDVKTILNMTAAWLSAHKSQSK